MRQFLSLLMTLKATLRPVVLGLSLVLLAESGCVMQPNISLSVTTADGEHLDVPLNTAAAPATDGTVTVKVFQFSPWDVPGKPRELAFSFIAEFEAGAQLKAVVIDDVTDSPIERIYDDPSAKLTKNNVWGAVSKPFAPQDEHVNWILTVENSIRIFRFTFTLADGSVHKILKPLFVPSNVKDFMRTQLGLKQP